MEWRRLNELRYWPAGNSCTMQSRIIQREAPATLSRLTLPCTGRCLPSSRAALAGNGGLLPGGPPLSQRTLPSRPSLSRKSSNFSARMAEMLLPLCQQRSSSTGRKVCSSTHFFPWQPNGETLAKVQYHRENISDLCPFASGWRASAKRPES